MDVGLGANRREYDPRHSGESGDLTKMDPSSEYGGGENIRGKCRETEGPMSDDLTCTVQVKLRLPAECGRVRRKVEVGGG